MTVAASEIIRRVAALVSDRRASHWSNPEALDWINDGQRRIVELKPDAGTAVVELELEEGAYQTLPAGYTQLIEVRRLLTNGGVTVGQAPRLTTRAAMTANMPDWETSTPAEQVEHWMYDRLDSKHYWVWPPQPQATTAILEGLLRKLVADITALDDPISIDDEYREALVEYLAMRITGKDGQAAAAGHQAAFYQCLGLKDLTVQKTDPNQRRKTPAEVRTEGSP